MSRFITRDEHRRMFEGRLCYVCGTEIQMRDGHHWQPLGILVHGGECNWRVKQEARHGRPIPDILASICGEIVPRKVETRAVDGFWTLCEFRPDAWTSGDELRRAYVKWAAGNPISRAEFSRKLAGRGLKEERNAASAWGWRGVALKDHE